jgi:foldase protein PrsA
VNEQLILIKAKEMGLDTLTDEEIASCQSQYDNLMNSIRTQYQSVIAAGGSTDATAATATAGTTSATTTLTAEQMSSVVEEQVNAYLSQYGYTPESLLAEIKNTAILDKVTAKVTEGVAPTEEEVQTAYNTKVEDAEKTYTETPSGYETAYSSNDTIYYVPAGARVVQQILIALSSDQQNAIKALRTAGSDAQADAQRDEYLATIKDKAQSVLDQISADHSNFADIMAANSDDTATSSGKKLAVVPSGSTYVAEFSAAATSLAKAGDMTGLVGSDYGYHIILCTDVPKEGAVNLKDLHDTIYNQLLSDQKDAKMQETLDSWKTSVKITTYKDRLLS